MKDFDDPKLRDAFGKDLARIAAKQLKKVAPQDRAQLLMLLQDAASLYTPYVSNEIDRLLETGK